MAKTDAYIAAPDVPGRHRMNFCDLLKGQLIGVIAEPPSPVKTPAATETLTEISNPRESGP